MEISSNLPDAPVNDIIIDPEFTQRLFAGTDVGVFVSENLGSSWNYLGENLPNAPITDLVLHNPSRTLIAATYGRSMYSINISTTPGITVVSPNGGEHFLMGDTTQITWTSNEVNSVKIELSITDGMDWLTIEESTPSDGVYDWIVEAPYTSWNCWMKISNVNDSTIYDISDTTFEIDMLPGVDDSTDTIIPYKFTLFQNYPNPFNPSTKIKYEIPERSFVSINVYDLLGDEIATLVNEEKPAGTYEVEFDGTGLPSGIYFYKLSGDNFSDTRKMLLLK
jgi:hypothetical protein